MKAQEFIPQAIVSQDGAQLLHLFQTEASLRPYLGLVTTVDATGSVVHPEKVSIGDRIGWMPTGHGSSIVKSKTFLPDTLHLEGVFMSGSMRFETDIGHVSVHFQGLKTIGINLYKIP